MKKKLSKKDKIIRDVFKYLVEENKKIIESGRGISPTVIAILFNNKKGISVLPMPLTESESSFEDKLLLSTLVRYMVEENLSVELFMVVSEAWGTLNNSVNPSDDPNRIEIFYACGEDSDGNNSTVVFEIKRNGRSVELRPYGELESSASFKWSSDVGNRVETRSSLVNTAWSTYRAHKKMLKQHNNRRKQLST